MFAINVKTESYIHEFNGSVSDLLRRQQLSSEHRKQTRQSWCNARQRARQQHSEEEQLQRLLAGRERERSAIQQESNLWQQELKRF